MKIFQAGAMFAAVLCLSAAQAETSGMAHPATNSAMSGSAMSNSSMSSGAMSGGAMTTNAMSGHMDKKKPKKKHAAMQGNSMGSSMGTGGAMNNTSGSMGH